MSRWCPIDDPHLARWNALQNPAVVHEDKAPLKINVNKPAQMSGRDLLGTQEWSGQFYRYIDLAFQQARAKALGRVHWWQSPYVLARLQADETINKHHLAALLAFRLRQMSWQDTLAAFQCRDVYLKRLEQAIQRTYRGL